MPTIVQRYLHLDLSKHVMRNVSRLMVCGMVCDNNINPTTAADAALRPFSAGTSRVKKFVHDNVLTNTGCMLTFGSSKSMQFLLACTQSQICSTPFLKQGKDMDNPVQKWLLTVLKRILGVRDTTLSWCVMRECGLEPLQFNWFRATMRLYNYLTQCNSTTAKQVIHADV